MIEVIPGTGGQHRVQRELPVGAGQEDLHLVVDEAFAAIRHQVGDTDRGGFGGGAVFKPEDQRLRRTLIGAPAGQVEQAAGDKEQAVWLAIWGATEVVETAAEAGRGGLGKVDGIHRIWKRPAPGGAGGLRTILRWKRAGRPQG